MIKSATYYIMLFQPMFISDKLCRSVPGTPSFSFGFRPKVCFGPQHRNGFQEFNRISQTASVFLSNVVLSHKTEIKVYLIINYCQISQLTLAKISQGNSCKPSLVLPCQSTIELKETFWNVTIGKAQVKIIKLMMAEFHLASYVDSVIVVQF